jgi:hypothetical protein
MSFFNFIMQNTCSRHGAGNHGSQRVIEVWPARRLTTPEGDVVAIRHGGSRTDLRFIPKGSQLPRWVGLEGQVSPVDINRWLKAA